MLQMLHNLVKIVQVFLQKFCVVCIIVLGEKYIAKYAVYNLFYHLFLYFHKMIGKLGQIHIHIQVLTAPVLIFQYQNTHKKKPIFVHVQYVICICISLLFCIFLISMYNVFVYRQYRINMDGKGIPLKRLKTESAIDE